jgi:hypothetical protein
MTEIAQKAKYIARFIVVCWIGIGIVVGIVFGIVHLLRNHEAIAVITVLVLVYSGMFGVLGSQQYKWKCDRQKWRSETEGKEGWGSLQKHAPPNEINGSEEADTGWK